MLSFDRSRAHAFATRPLHRPSGGPPPPLRVAPLNQISNAIAASIDQQNIATREIAGNVQQASRSAQDVNANIAGVTDAARNVGSAAGRMMEASAGLSSQSEKLKGEVQTFLNSIRAA